MGSAVCRNCWTWYANGETVCPSCRIPLTGDDGGLPTSTTPTMGVGSAPQGPSATPAMGSAPLGASIGLNPLLPIAAIGAVAIIGAGIMLSLHLGGPAKASDGSFQVQAPKGWSPSTTSEVAGYPVILALSAPGLDGIKSDFAVADFGQQISISQISGNWDAVVANSNLGKEGRFGPLTPTTVGGAPALTVDYQGTTFSGQLLFIDYGGKTYIVALASRPADFQRLRSTDFAQILSSWEWLH